MTGDALICLACGAAGVVCLAVAVRAIIDRRKAG
jgi:hypothetical protein